MAKSRDSDWYSVSVDSLRIWTGIFFVAVLILGGFFGYRTWDLHAEKRAASKVMDEARVLIQSLENRQELAQFRTDFSSARNSLEKARTAYSREVWTEALEHAEESRDLLQSIFDHIHNPGLAGGGRFVAVNGRVEYQRGNSGTWREARSGISLQAGDWVRTSGNGSAEMVSPEGISFQVRPGTVLVFRSGSGDPVGGSIEMDYGWVDLSTARRSAKVTTRAAEVRVKQASAASVSYDRESKEARYTAYRGGLEVSTESGEVREVKALEQVVQAAGHLSEPAAVPSQPLPLRPPDNVEINLDDNQQLTLAWQPIEGARRYALQVSSGRLFVDNLVDVTNRTKTTATLGLQAEGSFVWRVAAFGRDGRQGPWSAAQRFRVVSLGTRQRETDTTPPELDLAEIQDLGNIFIITGTTEPGCSVEVDGEPVTVNADGSFKKIHEVTSQGWVTLDIRAIDAAGNTTPVERRVFVESL